MSLYFTIQILDGPNGPGWYVDVRDPGARTEYIPMVRIPPDKMNGIVNVFNEATKGRPLNSNLGSFGQDKWVQGTDLTSAIAKGNEQIRLDTQKALDEAEAVASKISDLRKTLRELE